MAKMTADMARSLFAYEPDTGLLRWKIKPSDRIKTGSIAGTKGRSGYVRVMYGQRSYMAHCIAWAVTHGEWPAQIDHKDRVRDNNRLCNLRLATRDENAKNRGLHSSNTSGFKGVSYAKQKRKWWARMRINGKRTSLGLFDSAEDAANAYTAAEILHHAEWGSRINVTQKDPSP